MLKSINFIPFIVLDSPHCSTFINKKKLIGSSIIASLDPLPVRIKYNKNKNKKKEIAFYGK